MLGPRSGPRMWLQRVTPVLRTLLEVTMVVLAGVRAMRLLWLRRLPLPPPQARSQTLSGLRRGRHGLGCLYRLPSPKVAREPLAPRVARVARVARDPQALPSPPLLQPSTLQL